MSPTTLPVRARAASEAAPTNDWFEAQLARLDYPGFAHRKRSGVVRHPVEVLLAALAFDDLEPRLVEALPWLLLHYEGFRAEQLAADVKAHDLQNRLGFTVALARQVAAKNDSFRNRLPELSQVESALEPSRLAREETFGQGHAPDRLREWLRDNRTDEARHWNLLTDLRVEHLPYVG